MEYPQDGYFFNNKGAVYNTCKVKPRSSIVVFGLGAVGLAVI